MTGDAQELLPALKETYDFIFMDAAKGQYIHFLPDIFRLLEMGGVLVSDNVLQGRRPDRIPLCRGTAEPDNLQTDAGIFVGVKAR